LGTFIVTHKRITRQETGENEGAHMNLKTEALISYFGAPRPHRTCDMHL